MGTTTATEYLRTAREYLRVSLDKSGYERSNVEQQDANRAAWPDLDFNGSAYSDTSISASRYSTKTRGGYDELIEDLRADRFGAGVLVLWEGSRGSRRVGEWVELIELCEDRSVRIAVTEDERIYDPGIPRDRKTLIDSASDSEYESAKLSGRMRRAFGANYVAGKPHGRLPYGYRRVHDERTGRLVAQEPEPAEAAVVVELFGRIAKGHSLRSIEKDFEARGIRTRPRVDRYGNEVPVRPFSAQHLRSIAKADLYRGKRVHIPDRHRGSRRGEATTVDATWPALVPETLWLAVQRILDDPSRKTTRPGRAKHLLSMIGRCDVCLGPLSATRRRGPREYGCRDGGHVRIDADGLDRLAEKAMLGYLARPDNVDRLTADDGNDDRLDQARLDAAKVRAELDDLYDRLGAGPDNGGLSAAAAARAEPTILARLKAAEAQVAELSTPSQLRGLIEPGEDVAQRWKAAPMSAKRTIAKMLLSPDMLGELRVTRSPTPGHRAPVEERVVWRTARQPGVQS